MGFHYKNKIVMGRSNDENCDTGKTASFIETLCDTGDECG